MTCPNRATSLAAIAILAGSSLLTHPVRAGTSSGIVTATATVVAVCLITATPMAFGNYVQTALSSSATLTVTCSPNTNYTITLDAGITSGASTSARRMNNSFGGTLPYGLYVDAGHTIPWASNAVSGIGTGLAQMVNVYGLIPANQYVIAGTYADVVTVTLTY
jgi:spore coat protein U-like protein